MIHNSITELIGNTPLVNLAKYAANRKLEAEIVAKVEFFNPGGSVKDRIALAMILDAEKIESFVTFLLFNEPFGSVFGSSCA